MLTGLASHPLERIEIAAFGRAAEVDIRPLSIETLIGVLDEQLSVSVNQVNALDLAKRQGISVTESRTEESHDYISLIRITGFFNNESISLSGALLGGCHPRLVCINGYEIEVVPEGTLLVTHHDDKPGVIAALGAILGDANVNISRMQVGTDDKGDQAMAVISVTNPLTEEVLAKISAVPAIRTVNQIAL